MGKLKKSGENSKAVEARNKKKESKAQANAKAAKSKEDAYWASQGDGQVSKAQKKKQEQEAKVSGIRSAAAHYIDRLSRERERGYENSLSSQYLFIFSKFSNKNFPISDEKRHRRRKKPESNLLLRKHNYLSRRNHRRLLLHKR